MPLLSAVNSTTALAQALLHIFDSGSVLRANATGYVVQNTNYTYALLGSGIGYIIENGQFMGFSSGVFTELRVLDSDGDLIGRISDMSLDTADLPALDDPDAAEQLLAMFAAQSWQVTGTAGADVLRLAAGAGLFSFSGVDIKGYDGNDTLAGGAGGDTISGGVGNDRIEDSAGNDSMQGNGGNDRFVQVAGANGNDTIDGGAGKDWLDGGAGDDSLLGGVERDTLNGGAGDDFVDGGQGNDRVLGSAGADHLVGGAGADFLDGGTGNDLIEGGDQADTIMGGEGNDTIDGGIGPDRLSGGDGADMFQFSINDGTDRIIGFSASEDQIFLALGAGETLRIIEKDGDTHLVHGTHRVIVENTGIEDIVEGTNFFWAQIA